MTAICIAICFMFFIDFFFVKGKAMEGITYCFGASFAKKTFDSLGLALY